MIRKLHRHLLAALLSALPLTALASGPRWVTGGPYYYPEGSPIVWYTSNVQYFTDPGDLSPYVNHAAADAIVNAAASVWTVPTASLNLLYGGALDEHADSTNTYPTGSGIVFPSDIQSSNYLNKQIAVLYDTDGSITDLLLGTGASSPSSCRQNAVTESVDSISTSGKIQHAILVLNGRCTGPAPEQQLQLQYQLMRAFGRVIGLAWSQTNDNVFTGSPSPTLQQALYWPIMHPIDVICGPYTYQCMPDPFTLRDDDISGLGLLYPVGTWVPSIPGKTDTLARGSRIRGTVTFPNGQGMQGVNVVVHRLEPFWTIPEAWESTSAVSGALFRRRTSTPVSKLASSPSTNMGSPNPILEGAYDIYRTPYYDTEVWQNFVLTTQPINPLYIGPYAVGPYDSNPVSPSGSAVQGSASGVHYTSLVTVNFNSTDAAPGCQTTQDGTESSPAAVPSTGWWSGNLCSYNHTAWSTLSVKANRSLTLEVTAQDENSLPTSSKAMPVLGLWNTTDALGTPPSLASAPSAFNSFVTGMTTLTTQTSQARQLRIAIADQRGDGRPDYAYQARILYADTVTPATIPAKGATITIHGMGFRAGNTVTIHGTPATVTSWTANTITAEAPSLHASTAITADITVRDLATGGTTTMTAALSYQAPQPELDLVSAPTGTLFTGTPAPVPFTVKALAADGTTPLPNTTVVLSATTGQVRFEACGQSACALSTDASGIASSAVTPLAPGPITLSAASAIGNVTASFVAASRVQTITALNPDLYLAEHSVLSWTAQVTLADNGASALGVPVRWTPLSGPISFNPALSSANAQSIAQSTATAGPLQGGTQASASACAWTSICARFSVTGISESDLRLAVVSGNLQSVDASATFSPVVFLVTDPSGHPVAGAAVTIHQTLALWSLPCPPQGRCPIAPIYSSSVTTLITGLDGTVTLTPLELAHTPEVTRIAAVAGTQGFVPLTLQKHP